MCQTAVAAKIYCKHRVPQLKAYTLKLHRRAENIPYLNSSCERVAYCDNVVSPNTGCKKIDLEQWEIAQRRYANSLRMLYFLQGEYDCAAHVLQRETAKIYRKSKVPGSHFHKVLQMFQRGRYTCMTIWKIGLVCLHSEQIRIKMIVNQHYIEKQIISTRICEENLLSRKASNYDLAVDFAFRAFFPFPERLPFWIRPAIIATALTGFVNCPTVLWHKESKYSFTYI